MVALAAEVVEPPAVTVALAVEVVEPPVVTVALAVEVAEPPGRSNEGSNEIYS